MTTKCDCQNCGSSFEFDPEDFHEQSRDGKRRYGQSVPCPHCQQPTTVYMDLPNPRNGNLASGLVEAVGAIARVLGGIFIWLIAIMLFVAGIALVMDSATRTETVMQQIYMAIHYCSGFVLIGLSALIVSVERRKRG